METERTMDEVRNDNGRHYVPCECGARLYLGAWGVAHLGTAVITRVCWKCSARVTLVASE